MGRWSAITPWPARATTRAPISRRAAAHDLKGLRTAIASSPQPLCRRPVSIRMRQESGAPRRSSLSNSSVGDAAGTEVGNGCGHGTGAVGGEEGRGVGDFGRGGEPLEQRALRELCLELGGGDPGGWARRGEVRLDERGLRDRVGTQADHPDAGWSQLEGQGTRERLNGGPGRCRTADQVSRHPAGNGCHRHDDTRALVGHPPGPRGRRDEVGTGVEGDGAGEGVRGQLRQGYAGGCGARAGRVERDVYSSRSLDDGVEMLLPRTPVKSVNLCCLSDAASSNDFRGDSIHLPHVASGQEEPCPLTCEGKYPLTGGRNSALISPMTDLSGKPGSLEREIDYMLRSAVADVPAVQRAYKAGGQQGEAEMTQTEAVMLLGRNVIGLREAILRLAREIDNIRSA